MDFGELQDALLPASATAAPKRRIAPVERAESLFSGAPGGRKAARVASGISELLTTARPKGKAASRRDGSSAAASAGPQPGIQELLAAVSALTDKVNTLSGAQASGVGVPTAR
eukprot:6006992-Amphidinium_carterae.1